MDLLARHIRRRTGSRAVTRLPAPTWVYLLGQAHTTPYDTSGLSSREGDFLLGSSTSWWAETATKRSLRSDDASGPLSPSRGDYRRYSKVRPEWP